MKRRFYKAEGSVIVVVVLILTVVLLTAGFFVFSKMIKGQKVRYSRDVVSQAKESIIGYAIAYKNLPATIAGSGAKNVDAWGNMLEYFSASEITTSKICSPSSVPNLLIVNGTQDGAFIVFSKGPNGTNETGTGPFIIQLPSPTYDDLVEYVKLEDLRKKICHEMRITTDSLPIGTEEFPYPPANLEATDGTLLYTWSIVSGALPPGLSLSGGQISGTPQGIGQPMSRNYPFTISVVDNEGRESRKDLTITINPNEPRITTTFLNYGYVSQSYTATLSITGGLSPYSWNSLSFPPLPPGLSLSNAGVISGTPTTAGTYSFTATAADSRSRTASKTLSIVIKPAGVVCPALTNTTPSPLPSGTVGSAYSSNITYTGGLAPVTCSISSGNLPPGLNRFGCTISGTPTAIGTYSFTTRVTDSCTIPGPQVSDKATSITINCPLFTGWSSSLPNATNCQSYSGSITVLGGYPSYLWSITAGALPSGINFCTGNTSATCTLSGAEVLSAPGNYNFTTRVTDSCIPVQSTSSGFTITVSPDSCYSTGIVLYNAKGGAQDSYRINGGVCQIWKDRDIINIMPGNTYEFFSDKRCNNPCSPYQISDYCNQKLYDANGNCMTQVIANCSFVDR